LTSRSRKPSIRLFFFPKTELGKEYDIYEEDGEKGQQYQTDTGPLDILAISKDKKRLLVVELKRDEPAMPL
jgi:hypothetical protein